MDEAKLIQTIGGALGGGALAGALILIVYRVALRVAERMISAIDRIAVVVDQHTEKDLAHHAEVRESVIRLEAKVDSALDWRERSGPVPRHHPDELSERTPTERPSEARRRNPRGSPTDH